MMSESTKREPLTNEDLSTRFGDANEMLQRVHLLFRCRQVIDHACKTAEAKSERFEQISLRTVAQHEVEDVARHEVQPRHIGHAVLSVRGETLRHCNQRWR